MLRVACLLKPDGIAVTRARRRLTSLLSCLVLTAACGGGGEPIRIGVAGPFTQPRGQSMQLAAQLAVDEINAGGGVRGRPLELVFRDDSAVAERAVSVAQQLYATPGLVAVIGHLTSGTTLAAARVYNGGERPVVQISPSASSPLVSDAGPWTFRVCPTDLLHGTRLADFAREQLGARRAAVLFRNDDYGRGIREVFVQHFVTEGGDVVADDPFLDDLPSFEPYLRRVVLRGGADVLMIAGTREGAERILPTADAVGLDLALMGGDGISGIEQGGVDAEGVYISTAYLPDRPGDRNSRFVRAYQQAFQGRLPDHRGAGTYDIVHLLARAIDAGGGDRRRLRDHLAGIGSRREAFEGVTGRIAFDAHGDVPAKDVVVGVVRGGRLVTAGPR